MTIHIRSLTAQDVDPLAAALAEAFRRDDLAVWIFPDPPGRDAALAGAERNLAFYRKHGYRELQRFDFPGASAWWMWRDPV